MAYDSISTSYFNHFPIYLSYHISVGLCFFRSHSYSRPCSKRSMRRRPAVCNAAVILCVNISVNSSPRSPLFSLFSILLTPNFPLSTTALPSHRLSQLDHYRPSRSVRSALIAAASLMHSALAQLVCASKEYSSPSYNTTCGEWGTILRTPQTVMPKNRHRAHAFT